MTAAEFEERLRALTLLHAKSTANVGCHACERSERCTDSTFLRDCTNVARSNYCSRCSDCAECSHCDGCTGCVSCSHCEDCASCSASAYLVRCTACRGCHYCFGCVGLANADFCILNERYERQEYFARVAELRRALRMGPGR